jgi:ankyrin repeat protein
MCCFMSSMLHSGCDVSALDRDEMTALSWACLRGHLVCVQVLLDGGCEINHSDKFGRTPLDLAAEKGHFRVVQVRFSPLAASGIR